MVSSRFARFAEVADAVAATRSKLRKRDLLAAYLRDLTDADLPVACTFFASRPLADPGDRLGLGWVQQSAALAAASGADQRAMGESYQRHSDFGDVAAELLDRAPQGDPLALGDVHAAFRRMASAAGAEERTALMASLFERASATEARYLARIAGRELRIGLREGLVIDAVARAFARDPRAVRRAASAAGDLGAVALAAKHDALDQVTIAYHAPVAFMLAAPIAYSTEYKDLAAAAWLVEDKYDSSDYTLYHRPFTPRPLPR